MKPKPSDDSSIDRLFSSIENLPELLRSLDTLRNYLALLKICQAY